MEKMLGGFSVLYRPPTIKMEAMHYGRVNLTINIANEKKKSKFYC
jgi:hypothetical protein